MRSDLLLLALLVPSTATGRYAPFVALLTHDGYRVTPNRDPFTAKTLAGYNLLVIAGARGAYDSLRGRRPDRRLGRLGECPEK